MAEDKAEKKEAPAGEGDPSADEGKSKKKKMIIIGAAALVLVGGGAGAFMMLSGGGGHGEEPAGGEHASAEAGHGEASGEAEGGHGEATAEEGHGEAKAEGHGGGGEHGEKKEGEHGEAKAEGHGGGGEHGEKKEGEHGEAKADKSLAAKSLEGDGTIGETFSLAPFHLNLGNPLENRYVRLEIAMEYKGGEEQKEELTKRQPQLRDAVVSVTSKKTREFLLSPDGKDQLRKELLIRVNRYMTRPIESVYITDILIE